MKITCLTTFLHGRDRYEKDDVRTVDDELGAYFVANGWASAGGEPVAPAHGPVTLAVQDGLMGQEADHG
jgi:hypothetical protein